LSRRKFLDKNGQTTVKMEALCPKDDTVGQPWDRVCIDIHYRNGGKTPAVGTLTHGSIYIGVQEDAERAVEEMAIPEYIGTEVGIGSNLGSGEDHWTTVQSEPLSDEQRKRYISGDWNVYVFGVIEYMDVFDDYHETGYCVMLLNWHTGVFAHCPWGVWMDKRLPYHPPYRPAHK
jgi:hypothetical protein